MRARSDTRRWSGLVLTVLLAGACGASSAGGGSGGAGGSRGAAGQSGAPGGASGGGGVGGAASSGVTFWGDVAPLYNAKCVPCHQEGGIAPFPLDDYTDAAAHAAAEGALTAAGQMPPYFMVHDGSCGSFQDERALTAAEKATITA